MMSPRCQAQQFSPEGELNLLAQQGAWYKHPSYTTSAKMDLMLWLKHRMREQGELRCT